MKKMLGLILLSGAFLTGCKDEQPVMTDSEIHAKVDSMVGAKMDELSRQASEDLDRRMAIEVKAKSDSIVQAAMTPDNAPIDNPAR